MKPAQYETAYEIKSPSTIIDRFIPGGKKNAVSISEIKEQTGYSETAIDEYVDQLIARGVPIIKSKTIFGITKYHKADSVEYYRILQEKYMGSKLCPKKELIHR